MTSTTWTPKWVCTDTHYKKGISRGGKIAKLTEKIEQMIKMAIIMMMMRQVMMTEKKADKFGQKISNKFYMCRKLACNG